MNFIYLQEVNSTNTYAKTNIEKLADKTIIHAERQTDGHGRLQRAWIDIGGENLFLSIVLKPSNTYKDIYSNLTQYLSVVLVKLLKEYGINAQIKWPNDVQINGKKISGILSESIIQGSNFKGIILGMGLNINTDKKDLEKVTDKDVTSMSVELNRTINTKTFRTQLTESFFSNYDEFLEKGFDFIKKDYINSTCFLNKEVCVQLLSEKKSGIAKSITDKGELVISDSEKEFVLSIGDIL